MKLKLKAIIPIIFEKGKEKGLKEIEIRNKIKEMIDVPERTLNPYLPESAKKHRYPKNRKLADSANYTENIENSSNGKASAKSFNMNNTTYIKSNSEPTSDVISRPAQKSLYVYGNWTLEELISKYQDIVMDYTCLELQLEKATMRIEELEESLEEQGVVFYDYDADDNDR